MFFLIDWVRRRLAAREPFPDAWREILRRRVPFYRGFDASQRGRFEDKLKVFLLTKSFEGVKGFVVDDEVKVVISAAAARLVMNLPDEHYDRLVEIVVYESHFKHHEEKGVVVLGQAYGPGTVVLSWEAVVGGLENPDDGHDTATHELAHALDAGDGEFDGTPELSTFEAYSPWTNVMSAAYRRLRERTRLDGREVLRDYGATNEAEFFAVATEAFFEKPKQMRRKHPELYETLKSYYRADPAA
ncbi:MAG: zinc-dependent peptidase [Polyangiaceae bacterium]|nr:zinc-dependent peptidase [Polyangiaceae bacterium]